MQNPSHSHPHLTYKYTKIRIITVFLSLFLDVYIYTSDKRYMPNPSYFIRNIEHYHTVLYLDFFHLIIGSVCILIHTSLIF